MAAGVENHHNFAWKETHDGKEVIVHRKGATPAGQGVLGVIPGSMASPAFVVRGKGSEQSLLSASHGAGRSPEKSWPTYAPFATPGVHAEPFQKRYWCPPPGSRYQPATGPEGSDGSEGSEGCEGKGA